MVTKDVLLQQILLQKTDLRNWYGALIRKTSKTVQ